MILGQGRGWGGVRGWGVVALPEQHLVGNPGNVNASCQGRFARGGPRVYDLYRPHKPTATERCDLQPEAIARVFGNNDFNETSFVVAVRLLKHIEQSL